MNDSLTFVIITSTLTLLLDFTLFFYHKFNFAAINVWPQEHNLKFGGVFHHTINSKSIKNQMRAIELTLQNLVSMNIMLYHRQSWRLLFLE